MRETTGVKEAAASRRWSRPAQTWPPATCGCFTSADEDNTEPPVPTGLGDLSPALRVVAEFLRIDRDLIAVAAQASPPLREPQVMSSLTGSRHSPCRRRTGCLPWSRAAKAPGRSR